ncbi:MAG: WxcM-like domain-containing protein, partial [Myxococcota bacterium]
RECNICDHVFIENQVVMGDRVTIKSGVQLWDGVELGNDVFVGPNATFTNDRWPRSRQWQEAYPKIVVKDGASIGANATILPGLTIGQHAMVGAGAVVTRNVPPYAVVAGNPARIVRYASKDGKQSKKVDAETKGQQQISLIEGVTLDVMPMIRDLRGNLTAREVDRGLPFVPKRYFVIFDVPSKEVRGAHAHKECHQLLICLRGSVNCVVDDGQQRTEHTLDSPEVALHIPPMVWGTQYKYTGDCILLVLASHPYDPDDYIREYDEFRAQAQKT